MMVLFCAGSRGPSLVPRSISLMAMDCSAAHDNGQTLPPSQKRYLPKVSGTPGTYGNFWQKWAGTST